MYTRSVSPEQAPDKATYLDLDFEGGNPVAIDGQKLSPASLLTQLNKVLHLTQSIIYWPTHTTQPHAAGYACHCPSLHWQK